MPNDIASALAQLGQFATSPQFPVLAGQLGAAAMGPNQNTWQANVGRVASGYGQSAIAANEAKSQGAKAEQMNAWLKQILPALMAGGPMTPEGEKGDTKKKFEVNPDGTYKINIEGNASTLGGNAPAGAAQPGQMDPKQAAPAQAPVQQPQPTQTPKIDPRMLPFLMALSGNSSGGANTNLTGLSPEDISKTVAGNVAGGKLAQDSVQNIFENTQKMAYANYLDRMPKAGMTAADKYRTPLEGADGFYYDYSPETKSWVNTGVKVTHKKLEGTPPMPYQFFPGADGTWVKGNKVGGGMEEAKPPPGKELPASAEQTRKDTEQQSKEDKRVVELADKIEGKAIDHTTKKPMKATQAEVEEFNSKANTPYVYRFIPGEKNMVFPDVPDKFEKIPLPPGMTSIGAHKGWINFRKQGGVGSFQAYVDQLNREAQTAATQH